MQCAWAAVRKKDSYDQAGLIFSLAAKMVRMNRDLAQAIVVRETAKELLCPELGTKYKALSAEASTASAEPGARHFFDELGQSVVRVRRFTRRSNSLLRERLLSRLSSAAERRPARICCLS